MHVGMATKRKDLYNAGVSRKLSTSISLLKIKHYLVIDEKSNRVTFARAGHCPSLYFDKNENSATYFKNKGLGLGILRNSNFHKYVQVNEFEYHSGDVLLLYTDGVTEAVNEEGDYLYVIAEKG